MDFENLTDEQLEKAKACGSVEELIALAKEEDVELSDEELEGVAGGFWDDFPCTDDLPGCGNFTSES